MNHSPSEWFWATKISLPLEGEAETGGSGFFNGSFGFSGGGLCRVLCGKLGRPCFFRRPDVDRRIERVVVLRIQIVLHDAQRVAEALEVYDFSCAQEFDRLTHVRIVDQAQQIVVGRAGFLLGRHIFKQIGDRVALGLERHRAPRCAGGELRVNARGVIDKVGIKAALLDLLGGQVAGKLIDDRGDHLHVCEFLGAYRSNGNVPIYQI